MPRMNILNAVEREAFNSPPVFNSFQRSILTSPPRRFAAGLRSPAWAGACKLLIKNCVIAGIISTFRRS